MSGCSLDIVGLGLSPSQMTVGGHQVLKQCRWVGYYGLAPGIRAALLADCPYAADLDMLLQAEQANGFVSRLEGRLFDAALRFSRIGLAVSGHPVAANTSSGLIARNLRARGVKVSILSAPSTLDAFMAAAGVDLVSLGATLVNALAWSGPRMGERALAIWNAGYLAPADQNALQCRLAEHFGAEFPVRLFRTTESGPLIETWPVSFPRLWERVDLATTLFLY